MKAKIIWTVLMLMVAGVVAAQTVYTTEDGVLSVVLPDDWVADEDDFQMFITNRAGITANILESGDIAIAIVRPGLLRELVGSSRASMDDVISILRLLAQSDGESFGDTVPGEFGAYLTASFRYRIARTGNEAQFMAVDTGHQIVAIQIVVPAGEMAQFNDEIRDVILSLRVHDVAVEVKSPK